MLRYDYTARGVLLPACTRGLARRGIGFTMSIFIANLAFAGNPELVGESKGAVLLASMISALLGLAWLRFAAEK